MIDILLTALAVAAFGGVAVAADRKIRAVQDKKQDKKKEGQLDDGIYFGKIVSTDLMIGPSIRWSAGIRLDDGTEIKAWADEKELRDILRRLKKDRPEGLCGTPVMISVELGDLKIISRRPVPPRG